MAFRKLTGDFPDSHDWGHEKTLEGALTEKRENVGPNQTKAFTVLKENGKKVTVWGSMVLDKLWEVPIGALVKITYIGDVKGKGPKPYHNYDIEVDDDGVGVQAHAENVFKK